MGLCSFKYNFIPIALQLLVKINPWDTCSGLHNVWQLGHPLPPVDKYICKLVAMATVSTAWRWRSNRIDVDTSEKSLPLWKHRPPHHEHDEHSKWQLFCVLGKLVAHTQDLAPSKSGKIPKLKVRIMIACEQFRDKIMLTLALFLPSLGLWGKCWLPIRLSYSITSEQKYQWKRRHCLHQNVRQIFLKSECLCPLAHVKESK